MVGSSRATELALQEHSDGSTYVGRLQAHGPDLATWLSSSALESSPLQNLVVPEGRSTSGWVPFNASHFVSLSNRLSLPKRAPRSHGC